jgi:two-component system, NarL family, nitrate/nitrite response regulator NarL
MSLGSRTLRTPAGCNAVGRRRCHACPVPARCLIVDDNGSFLEAASVLLERQGLTVAGVASTAADALREAERLKPDVVLVDLMLGRESGFDVARRLVEEDGHGPAVILISTHSEADFADLIAGTRAAGFVSKSDLSASEIDRILAGRAG